MNQLLIALNMWRLIPIWFMICTAPYGAKRLIRNELNYWNKCAQIRETSKFIIFSKLMCFHREYRNVLENRFRKVGKFRRGVLRILFPLMDTLQICCDDIGECLFIQHGFATQISAKKIGAYCWINQQVTIGWTFEDEPPVIGNGVRISAGAKVLGKITINDNAIVAANAVVIKDVAENAIVGGVPARVIGGNKEHKLYLSEEL